MQNLAEATKVGIGAAAASFIAIKLGLYLYGFSSKGPVVGSAAASS